MENPGNYPVDERNPELEEHYRQILGLLGEDAEREGLVKTPQRVARAMQTLTRGYRMDPKAVLNSAKFKEDYSHPWYPEEVKQQAPFLCAAS